MTNPDNNSPICTINKYRPWSIIESPCLKRMSNKKLSIKEVDTEIYTLPVRNSNSKFISITSNRNIKPNTPIFLIPKPPILSPIPLPKANYDHFRPINLPNTTSLRILIKYNRNCNSVIIRLQNCSFKSFVDPLWKRKLMNKYKIRDRGNM